MRQFQLPPRLATIARLVPPGARVADVGTDHGHLAIFLADLGHPVIATDIGPEPLARAARNIAASVPLDPGDPVPSNLPLDSQPVSAVSSGNIELRLGDGLAVLEPDEVDVIVMAGMGGDTIVEMLTPWSSGDKLLILQPMSHAEKLREALFDEGFCIEDEIIVPEPGRLYPVFTARRGHPVRPQGHPYVSAPLLDSTVEEAVRYRQLVIHRLRRALEGLAASERESDKPRAEEMRRVLDELLSFAGSLREEPEIL